MNSNYDLSERGGREREKCSLLFLLLSLFFFSVGGGGSFYDLYLKGVNEITFIIKGKLDKPEKSLLIDLIQRY